eukprot:CAMPEP_0185759094 /NCGR_PEP_ID=MMETSP1174-20130828/17809_1 /TAXON_ID=35687 /ORGANISM="Dictyocha speculum, Strain CCMP1381" /LENGTH=49 /DNA_ID= /DNA_START= /DNA_END= /DNA_ORIENTATION=
MPSLSTSASELKSPMHTILPPYFSSNSDTTLSTIMLKLLIAAGGTRSVV